MPRVLCVCLGNICRSPAAEGVLRAKAGERRMKLDIDSAGTGAWHVGAPPDKRMIAAAAARGLDISGQRARQVDLADFYEFDFILAMDSSNYADLKDMAPPNKECALHLFLEFAKGDTLETPDPYYGGAEGFDHVLDLVERGAAGFLNFLERR
ncbi:MAG: low molecular weight protein-tyrosine-phosphatase [Pseudomonadota bacterium]